MSVRTYAPVRLSDDRRFCVGSLGRPLSFRNARVTHFSEKPGTDIAGCLDAVNIAQHIIFDRKGGLHHPYLPQTRGYRPPLKRYQVDLKHWNFGLDVLHQTNDSHYDVIRRL